MKARVLKPPNQTPAQALWVCKNCGTPTDFTGYSNSCHHCSNNITTELIAVPDGIAYIYQEQKA